MKQFTVNLLRALVVGAALNLQLSIMLAQSTGHSVLTITNPMPADYDHFGVSVAAMGSERVLIGAPTDSNGGSPVGAAYLFSAGGMLLTTFTNPTPTADDDFGYSVAAVGLDWVLIGADWDDTGANNAGSAYLFGTNGTLVTTFTNPTPVFFDAFGFSVAAAGTDRVLIGAYSDDTGATSAGAAYLFSTNGDLLTTLTNPWPADFDQFGYSVAAVGSERVLVGSPGDSTGAGYAGSAYLLSTGGALLTTFTNPTPAYFDLFGSSVVAVGSDHVLIGAPNDDTGGTNAGAVYLFSTNGVLLITFTNPTPATDDFFGFSVAAGADRLLIGSPGDDSGATDSGAAYLFNTTGTLLTTFTNPTLATIDFSFGVALAFVDADRLVIGAPSDSTGATETGAVYLFSPTLQTPEAPSLTILLTVTNTIIVSWPSPWTDWTLQETTNGVSSVNWSNAPGPIQDDGTNKTLIVNPPTGNRFYRLFKLWVASQLKSHFSGAENTSV